ncbi:MAG: hypothetical protein KKC79_14260, partial [Gammaproteobacteria bacterium]|nr:hypothetical protein [Gammaproteobacteria bacterium]
MRDTGAPAARRASRRNSAARFEAGLFQWVLIAGGVALLLGVWGFFLSGHDDWNGRTKLHHALIQALQAFFLNASPEAMTNWQTWLASLLAPATTASAI